MKFNKNIRAYIVTHSKEGKYIHTEFNSFNSIEEIKQHLKVKMKGCGIVYVSISQYGGYCNNFNFRTY